MSLTVIPFVFFSLSPNQKPMPGMLPILPIRSLSIMPEVYSDMLIRFGLNERSVKYRARMCENCVESVLTRAEIGNAHAAVKTSEYFAWHHVPYGFSELGAGVNGLEKEKENNEEKAEGKEKEARSPILSLS